MKTRLSGLWESLSTSFWFVPAAMFLAASVLIEITLRIDRALPHEWWVEQVPFAWEVWGGGAEGARVVLTSIASTMITVLSVVFSITVVVLALAAHQYGPHVVRKFMRDRGNQLTLGSFLATFVYSMTVVSVVREEVFVPDLSIVTAMLLGTFSVCMLIYFIHHIATSIQPERLIAGIGTGLAALIERLYPPYPEQAPPPDAPSLPERFEEEALRILAASSGYLQAIDNERLMQLAAAGDLLLRLPQRPGDFVHKGGTLAEAWPAERCPPELAGRIGAAFSLGPNRTEAQDVRFPVDQLAEIAIRALSPGVNDPFTALICVDWLGSGLILLAQRGVPSRYLCDAQERLRLIAEPITFGEVADAAFDQIRQYASEPVELRLLETIAKIARHARRDEDREALRRHAELVHRAGQQTTPRMPAAPALKEVEESYHAALQALAPQAAAVH